jgi:DNA-binding IclR family transcriptional regulator
VTGPPITSQAKENIKSFLNQPGRERTSHTLGTIAHAVKLSQTYTQRMLEELKEEGAVVKTSNYRERPQTWRGAMT